MDRRSVHSSQLRTLNPLQMQRAVGQRHVRFPLRRIAISLSLPLFNDGRSLKASVWDARNICSEKCRCRDTNEREMATCEDDWFSGGPIVSL